MLLLAVGFAPVLAFGVAAAWANAAAHRLEVVDLTGEAPLSKRRERSSRVDAVVLHQTGFSRGLEPRRYRKVTAHFVVLENGTVLQLHPMSAKLWASDEFNERSVAIEFVGNFPSANGRWWMPERFGRHHPTAAQLDAGRRLLRVLHRAGVNHVFAHRQSSASRGNDPGPEVWRHVGAWAVRALGMSDGGPGFHVGDGAPIPDAWRSAALA